MALIVPYRYWININVVICADVWYTHMAHLYLFNTDRARLTPYKEKVSPLRHWESVQYHFGVSVDYLYQIQKAQRPTQKISPIISKCPKISQNMGWSKKDKITESKNSKQGLINQIKFIRHFIIFLVHFISYVGFMHQAKLNS